MQKLYIDRIIGEILDENRTHNNIFHTKCSSWVNVVTIVKRMSDNSFGRYGRSLRITRLSEQKGFNL